MLIKNRDERRDATIDKTVAEDYVFHIEVLDL